MLRQHSFRSRLATSPTLTLWVLFLAVMLWVLPDMHEGMRWAALGVALMTTIGVMEWNNRASLLRVRSRMTSSAFLTLLCLFPQWHTEPLPLLATLALLGNYVLFFNTYQNYRPEGYLFHSLLLLSLSSLLYPTLLYFAMVYPFYLLFSFRMFSIRAFFAGVFGILLPYLYWAVYAVWAGTIEDVWAGWTTAFLPEMPHYERIALWQFAAFGFVVLLFFPALFHFIKTMGMEKRRTLAYFAVLISQTFLQLAFLALQPQAFSFLFPLLLLTISPLLAHHYALAKGRAADLWFSCVLVLAVLLGSFNYFDLWNIFSTF